MATANKCPRHPKVPPYSDYHTGDVLCPNCGLVLDKIIDDGAEWRTFDDDKEGKSRVGGAENPLLSSAFNLSTRVAAPIGGTNRFGRFITQKYKGRSVDNALVAALKAISNIADRLNLSESIINQAFRLYCALYEKRKLKGNILVLDTKTAACLYVACKMDGCARTSQEICGATEYSRRQILHWAHVIIVELNIKIGEPSICEYIDRFSAILLCSKPTRMFAYRIARRLDQLGICKKEMSPLLAAAAICVATECIENQPIDEMDFSDQLKLRADRLQTWHRRVKKMIESGKIVV